MSSVLDTVLESLEKNLNRRGLIRQGSCRPYHPIWFLAETERNIFLWRNGFSIEDHDQFDFWVNVPHLVEKRLVQLKGYSPDNPFMNPLWGELPFETEQNSGEADYLESFLDVAKDILPHAHAISHLGSTLRQESADPKERPAILLPFKPGKL